MSPRYAIIVGNAVRQRAELLQRLSSNGGLTLAIVTNRLAVLVNPSCPCIALAKGGCILGSVFRRGGPTEPIISVTAAEQDSIASSGGQALLRLFWGGYVAAIPIPDRVRIFREPSGVLPCYYAESAGFLILASDAKLLAEAGATTRIDFEEIGRQLYRAFVPAPSTAIHGIRELLAGFSLSVAAIMHEEEPIWSPWDYVVDRDDSLDAAAERLSSIVNETVQAWVSTSGRLLLSVSGGLDSSVLAACLARAAADTVCLTMFADDPTGDERPFARALCNHLRLPLIEWPYRLEDVDIDEPLAAHLPRPRDRTQANAYERVHLEVAREIGATAFMTGNGGDSVFGYSQSAAPVADRYLSHGLAPGMFVSLLDVCHQTGCNIFEAVGQAWRFAHRSPRFRIAPKGLLLHQDFVAAIAPAELAHPWLDAPAGSLPGKAAHIASILRVQSHLEASRAYHLPVLSPLMSQPIVEACLEIPSWQWRAGGRDRSVARRAFATDFPPIVRNRRVKGSPSGFGARLLDYYRRPILERLVGGKLASQGIIDRAAIENILVGERPVPHPERVRILELVNAEAWIANWDASAKVNQTA